MLTLKQVEEQLAKRERELKEYVEQANVQIAALRGAIKQLEELKELLIDDANEKEKTESK